METVLVDVGSDIRQKTIKNLLKAQERIADVGSAKENIQMARFLLKASKKFNGEIQQFGLEKD